MVGSAHFSRSRAGALALAAVLAACGGHAGRPGAGPRPAAEPAGAAAPLELVHIDEGPRDNWLVRQGEVAAHVVVSERPAARLVVAFPAGNEGAGVWFRPGAPRSLRLVEPPRPVVEGERRGVRFVLEAEGEAEPETVLLESVRTLRDFADLGTIEHRVAVLGPLAPERSDGRGGRTTYRRAHADGRNATELVLAPAPGGRIEVTATTSWEPLTPIPASEVLDERGRELLSRASGEERAALERSVAVLAFLSYDEKLLAGSWRFATYFGRDTLMSLRLLGTVASERLRRAGLRSVLERVDDRGRVAHEEDVGGQAILRAVEAGGPPEARTVLDYSMADEHLMLLPALVELAPELAAEPAALRNRALVEALAAEPWVALEPGLPAGDWRDSEEGLGGGRVSFGVNAALVPAALAAAGAPAAEVAERAGRARAAFLVERGVDEVRAAGLRYLATVSADEAAALRAQPLGEATVGAFLDGGPAPAGLEAGLAFHAIALDEAGRPIPVAHTDDAFALLDLELEPAVVERIVALYRLPFPIGLRTDAGLVVASPVHSTRPGELETFDRTHYHGTVVWSWQHSLVLAGLARTLRRLEARGAEDPEAARVAGLVRETLVELRDLVSSLARVRAGELWSWGEREGRIVPVPYGREGDVTESNAAQLWSATDLGVAAELEAALGSR